MRRHTGMVLTAILIATLPGSAAEPEHSPHDNPASGVLRVLTEPSTRGQCTQCHPSHGADDMGVEAPPVLFTDNTNLLAFWTAGAAPCHAERPVNYPLTENDRLPDIDPNAGYFEANDGGVRRVGVQYRGRWPGRQVYTSTRIFGGTSGGSHYASPHARDADMPRRDAGGEGLCLNCHDPHGDAGHLDMLLLPYGGISGHESSGPPAGYHLCFSCHGSGGPGGMDLRNTYAADWYDAGLNGDTAGHQIRRNARVALSWPAHVQAGDRLPCYDCHNPHGSIGYNGTQPNAFLISDERPGWSDLTATKSDPVQSRRFCLGCHIPSDGIPGTQVVEGIVMNTLSNEDGHASTDPDGCFTCHGADVSGPTAHNVHNPAMGADIPPGPVGP